MSFPVTARYFLNYRNSDTGLAPAPTFKRADNFAGVGAPTITEVSNGEYYFDWTWTTSTDPDITFVIDGGASIPTEEVRYIKGVISPRDRYIDEPISQIKDDVWNDVVNRSVGTKGDFVEHIGVDGDAVNAATVFGQVYKARDVVMGGSGFGGTGVDVKTVNDSLTDAKGAGFSTGADSLHVLSGEITNINTDTDPTHIADAVWDAATTGNITPGTMGGLVNTASTSGTTAAPTIASAVWDTALNAHTTAGSFGQTLQLEDSGLVQASASTTVTLRAGASSINDFYKNGLLAITSGTGIGQSRSVTAYDGTTKIATVDRAWGTNPVATDGYTISPAAPSSSLTNAGIATAVWDEPLSSHTTPGSLGQAQQLEDSGIAQGGAASTITLKAGASAVHDFYKNGLILVTSGTGTGQSRSITAYDGTTKVATVDRTWGTTPINGDGYAVFPAAPSSSLTNAGIAGAVWDEAITSHTLVGSFGQTLQLLNNGTAQGGAAATITLANTASGTDSFYNNALLVITGGQAIGQARTITAYVGASRVATVDRAWTSNPNGTSQYIILPASQSPLDTASIAGAVWNEPIAGHLTAGSTGEKLSSAGINFQFTANGDTVRPLLFSVSSPKHTQVNVVYSEPVVMTTGSNGALNLSNYSIAGLTISAVSSLTAQSVALTTSAQTPNFLYTLVVVNVEDLSGNTIL